MSEFKQVLVVGLGYIGLPTASVLADRQIKVVGLDVNSEAVDTINRGEIHIVEPGLQQVVEKAVREGFLRATTEAEAADVFVIAVPTPFIGEEHEPDLSYVEAAVRSIAPVVKNGNLILLESTSPVGTTEKAAEWLAEERSDLQMNWLQNKVDVHLAYCPERVLPGKVLHELVKNDRVVGGITAECGAMAERFYKLFVEGKIHRTDSRTAELVKLSENSFRDVNIAFANELSLIGDKLGIDPYELIDLANQHPRVNILQPGPGVGGHCIAVDPWFIVYSAPSQARLIRTAREVNDHKPHFVVNKVKELCEESKSQRVACLGLSFKANIDDLRESPAMDIVQGLASNTDYELLVVEPNIKETPQSLAGFAKLELTTLESALERADVLLVLVDHQEFLEGLSQEDFTSRPFVDTRGVFARIRSKRIRSVG